MSDKSMDLDKPSSARIYDYFLHGKDNYDVDREAAARIREIWPTVEAGVRYNRDFMGRAVRELSALGVRQFFDIGTGIPTQPNLHQIAQEINPEARVVYVDRDPVVLAHANALMLSTKQGRVTFIDADLTEPESILAAPKLRETLNLGEPVALSLIAVLHFVPDDQDPYKIVHTLMDALPTGSYLVISHITTDFDPEVMERALQTYRASGVFAQSRDREEVAGFFDGYELLDPGVVGVHRWRPGIQPPASHDPEAGCWAGIARKR
ncbi:SAM-dependent methyltransferase [Nocardia alni]|uniref:SAM-dependent methyltransferase n=1 Tax=Nocardia alni TaxID=2815723 RepID=UPI0020B245EE|nr:SAM-dependent methyltransferase [Nocardia alni]